MPGRPNRLASPCLAACLVAAGGLLSAMHRPPAAGVEIYVSVADAKGKPVKGLGPADFTVTLDGAPQEILAAEPATTPLSVMLLTDRLGLNSTYPAYEIHQVLADFTKAIRAGIPDSRLALFTFDGPTILVTKFTSAPAELDRSLGRLATSSQDAMLLDALSDVCREMDQAPSARRVIFTVLSAYRPDQSNTRSEIVIEQLRLSGAALWAVEVRTAAGGNYSNPSRELVLDRGSDLSGGWHDTVASPSGLESSARRMADLLVSQYVVRFGPADRPATNQLAVGVRQPGLRVFAPRWLSH